MIIPTEKILTDLNEPKLSLLILHRSSNALFTELIPLLAFSSEINFFTIFNEKDGNRIFFFEEYINIKNQKPKVGMAIKINKTPIKVAPTNNALKPAINANIVPTKTSAMISIVVTQAAFPART